MGPNPNNSYKKKKKKQKNFTGFYTEVNPMDQLID